MWGGCVASSLELETLCSRILKFKKVWEPSSEQKLQKERQGKVQGRVGRPPRTEIDAGQPVPP